MNILSSFRQEHDMMQFEYLKDLHFFQMQDRRQTEAKAEDYLGRLCRNASERLQEQHLRTGTELMQKVEQTQIYLEMCLLRQHMYKYIWRKKNKTDVRRKVDKEKRGIISDSQVSGFQEQE